MAGKPIRLGKAAGELNVGIATLVEFLDSKGVKIELNPNTKLESDHYEILQKEFAADQTLKEQAKLTAVKREKRETISIRETKEEETPSENIQEEDESPISIEEIKRAVFEEPKSEPVAVEKEVVKETPPVEEPKEEVSEGNNVHNAEAKTIGEGDLQVQVLGKIDLDKLNTKTRPDKKKTDPSDRKKEFKKPVLPPPPAPKVETKTVEPIVEEPREIETIRVERQVLSGPTVLGKIELPVDRPKTQGNFNKGNNQSNDAKKKRKRIKKIDGAKPGETNQAGGNNAGNNANNNQGNRPQQNKPGNNPYKKGAQ